MKPRAKSDPVTNGRVPDEEYLDLLVDVADEVHEAMLELDRAISRLDAALARHKELRALR